MALIKKSTSSRPYLPNSSETLARVPEAISSYLAARSRMLISQRAEQIGHAGDYQITQE